jgi:chromosome segregation ATPase
MSEKKLDHIIATLADMLTMFGKRFDAIDDRLDRHEQILNEHTKQQAEHARDFGAIKTQLAQDLDKRKQLEVRLTNVEKRIAAR